jgi:hypothetical protein
MKTVKKIIKAFLLVAMFFVFTRCSDVLDKHNLNSLGDQIWEDESQAALFVNSLYVSNMPGMSLGQNSQLCDETWSGEENYTNLMYGFVGPDNTSVVSVFHRSNFELIRRINLCLDGLEKSSLSDRQKEPIMGQALFFRAFRYFEMVRLYGGVPMVMEAQDPFSEDLNVPRSKTSESIDLIVTDLDQAIEYLPVDWQVAEDNGRITSGAAAAFKGRVLLTWASPLFNRNNDQSRWQRAYDANKQAMDILAQMRVPRSLHPDFKSIFTSDILTNVESVIFKRYSSSAGTAYTTGWEKSIRPPSSEGNGGFNPTWELVKAFPMANGKLIFEQGSGYDSVVYWKNRDPRFYATIVYNGAEWDLNGRSEDTQWTFRNVNESNRVPSTGFYCRKACDPLIAPENTGQTSTSWHELRYAEVLLNFAECANELGKTAEALESVRKIRARAGIEPGAGDYGISNSVPKERLREIIMVERQVEFAFENKRYWDMRRRLMFREDLGIWNRKLNGSQRHGFTITVKSPWGNKITDTASPYYGWMRIDTAHFKGHLDINTPASFNNYYTVRIKNMDLYNGLNQNISYLELYDFFGISASLIQKSPAVEQTLGWINGTFDPLAD